MPELSNVYLINMNANLVGCKSSTCPGLEPETTCGSVGFYRKALQIQEQQPLIIFLERILFQ